MTEILNWLDNREFSMLFWLSLILIFMLWNKGLRKSLLNVVKTITHSQIGTMLLLITTYTLGVIIALQKIGFWEIDLIKESLLWLFGFAFVSLVKLNTSKVSKSQFKDLLIDSFKLTMIIEFIANFYVLNLIGELILVPFVVLIALLIAYSDVYQSDENKYALVNKYLNKLLNSIVIGLLLFVIYGLVSDPKSLLTLINLKEITLPIILTISILPVLYLIALYSVYESFYVRLYYTLKQNKKLARYAKWKIFFRCGINIDRLKKIEKNILHKRLLSKADLRSFLSMY